MRNSSKRHQRISVREDKSPDAPMTIDEFCKWAGISVRQYYLQKKAGIAPREMRMGRRTIRIAREEAQAWAKRLTERGAP